MANHNDETETTRSLAGRTLLSAAVAAAALCAAAGVVVAATPKNALVMAWNVDAISTFDPAQVGEVVTNEILQNTCDTLVDFDPADERKVIPSFAERWDVSPDRKEITFHLRKNAKFPSGNAVSAEDVAWSLHRVVKLNFGNAATLTEYGFTKDNVEQSIVATGADTLVLKLDKPYPTTLVLQAIAANRVSMVMDKKTLMANEQGGDLGNKYLTTRTACVGPYKLTRWNAGESIVLEANDGYWGKAPGLKRVLIRHVAEPGTQRLLLSQGDVDVARDLTPEDLRDLEASKDVSIVKVLRPQLFYWGFNVADGPFSKEKVRLAMRYLVDYDGLAKTVMTYLGVPRASFAQLGAVGALDEKEGQPFKLDLDKAKQLLAEAGYPNGFEATMIFGTLPHANPIAQSVQQNAAKVGVKLSLERMANAQLFSKVRGREYQSAMLAWQTGVPDAHGNASRLVFNPDNRLEAKQTQYPSWRSAYQDIALNKQIDEALLEADPSRRDALYAGIQKDVMAKGPMAFMFQMNSVAGVRKDLKSWTWNGFRTYYERAAK